MKNTNKTNEQLLAEIDKLNVKVAELKDKEDESKNIDKEAKMWRKAIDNSSDVVWILDKEQNILQSNSAAEGFFNKPCSDFIGKHCYEIVHGTKEPIPECPFSRMKMGIRGSVLLFHEQKNRSPNAHFHV